MNTHSYFSLFGTIWLCTGSLAADPLAEWTWRNPLPQGNGGMSIAFGDDRFISAGLVGTLMHSTDGLNWAPLRSPTEKPLSGIAYGNGIFVAVGPDVILRSGDSGNGWSVQQSPTGSSNALLSVHFVNGSFFVGAHEGMMLVSQDGIDWQVRLLPRKARLHGLAFGEGHYVSVGSEGIIVSDDGINWRWVQDDAGAGTLTAVSFGNGNYVAVGGSGTILISDDSEQWSNRSLPERSGYFSDILYTNQCFVASLWGGGVRLSGDGVNWTNPAPSFKGILSALVYARGLYVGVGTPPRVGRPRGILGIIKSCGMD